MLRRSNLQSPIEALYSAAAAKAASASTGGEARYERGRCGARRPFPVTSDSVPRTPGATPTPAGASGSSRSKAAVSTGPGVAGQVAAGSCITVGAYAVAMAIAPTVALVISDEAQPFIVAVALVIMVLVLAVGVLTTRRRGATRPTAPEPEEAVEKKGSDVRVIERRASAQSLPGEPRRRAEETAPEPEEPLEKVGSDVDAIEPRAGGQALAGEPAQATATEQADEDGMQAVAEPGPVGERTPSGERDELRPKLDSRGELSATGEGNSRAADDRSQASETLSTTPVSAEASNEPPHHKTPGRALVERVQERPALAIAATLAGGLLLRSMIRRS